MHMCILMNSLWPPADTIWRERSRPPLAQAMACPLFGAQLLPETMLTYSIWPLGTNFI